MLIYEYLSDLIPNYNFEHSNLRPSLHSELKAISSKMWELGHARDRAAEEHG